MLRFWVLPYMDQSAFEFLTSMPGSHVDAMSFGNKQTIFVRWIHGIFQFSNCLFQIMCTHARGIYNGAKCEVAANMFQNNFLESMLTNFFADFVKKMINMNLLI